MREIVKKFLLKSHYPIYPVGRLVMALLTAACLLWLTADNLFHFDTSHDKKHSLSPASLKVLQNLKEPVEFLVFLDNGKKSQFDKKKQIEHFFQRLQFHKKDLHYQFFNAHKNWELARKYQLSGVEEIVVHYRNDFKKFKTLDEATVINTLLQLNSHKDNWIVFLEGHGEKSPYQELSKIAQLLKKRQAKIQTLNLANTPVVPRNTTLLVIAAPRIALSAHEISIILRYINQGGQLLWLHDPGYSPGMSLIANRLGLQIIPGVVLDTALGQKKPAFVVINQYNQALAAIQDLQGFNSVFPVAAAFKYISNNKVNPFTATSLFKSSRNSWSETRIQDQSIKRFDANSHDSRGPLPLAYALQRKINDLKTEQRIVVTGDSDFLSNRYLAYGANQQLALNLFHWLSHHDDMIGIYNPAISDRLLNLDYPDIIINSSVFALVLPVLYLVTGFWLYRRRLARTQ